ncbi:MAG: two-component system response regulator [Candidatus Cloacimonadota bacterium]|nr:MAG: two-component system response regulator [Candidatus Cloacimonadota bacterium]PIE79278.1 MAG: two-component system response regulator [Candidatus Delongbacteria bacterium]
MARILVVDDSLVMKRKLKLILAKAGHRIVAFASNGIFALKEYERHKPDIVTMDITMPSMNGIDAVKRILNLYPKARIIMISAQNQQNLIFSAIEAGAKHYIIKPIKEEKLLDVVDQVLRDYP